MVFDQVRDMIASQLQLDAATIKPESRLVEDLKADSANVMVMILELENLFGIEVEDEVILNLKFVAHSGQWFAFLFASVLSSAVAKIHRIA